MLPLIAFVTALQVQVRTDTAAHPAGEPRKREISVTIGVGDDGAGRREPKRIPVTAQHLATAFADAAAKSLLERARAARMEQDAELQNYDAKAYQRISAGLGFAAIGRDRLAFRNESAARVRWRKDVGVQVELTGARTVIPIAPDEAEKEAENEMFRDFSAPVPYYPGREELLILNGDRRVRAQVDERDLVHPLAEGAEAYYTYASGDSITMRLSNGTVVRLRELQVRPRAPKWNVIVGSLWFDRDRGQLVRAAYRFAAPMNIWEVARDEAETKEDSADMDDVPVWVKPMISPMVLQLKGVAIEYGLYNGRFWLPRSRRVDGAVQIGFMHAPAQLDQKFEYASVNAAQSIDSFTVTEARPSRDSLRALRRDPKWRDSVRVARRAREDSVEKKLRPLLTCDSTGYATRTMTTGDDRMPVKYRVPCDVAALEHSPDLPKSIYDDGEAVFGDRERDALMQRALDLRAQAVWAPQRPQLGWGVEHLRYNRVEGLSVGGALDEQFGMGYFGHVEGTIATADPSPNVALQLGRSNLVRSVHVAGYRRLAYANDWGNPLSFGSSLSSLLFGRDEGFYYRAFGVEVGGRAEGANEGAPRLDWRAFVEQNGAVSPHADFSLGGNLGRPNIVATRATYGGLGFHLSGSRGLDPRGFRLLGDARLEVASTADSGYGRALGEVTLSHGLPARLAGALTLGAGSSAGALPPQRRFYLGGTQTVRGQSADTAQSGTAFWLGRAELGRELGYARPSVFADFGWTGDRDRWRDVGRPLSGVGIGSSFMDGLIRVDLARGIHPRRQTVLSLYLESRF